MKGADAIVYCIHYRKINSRPNTRSSYEFLLQKFGQRYLGKVSDQEAIGWIESLHGLAE